MTDNPRTRELLHHLATCPGHDEVKSDFRQLLVEEFGVELGALDFERRVPEVRGRLDALIGRTVFEAKQNLDQEWDDVVRRMPDYLRSGGRIAFVLPLAALTRGQFEKFRKGSFTGARIAWDEAWTMDDDVQPLFPVPSCVIFGRRRATAKALPDKVRAYSGLLPMRDASESVADHP